MVEGAGLLAIAVSGSLPVALLGGMAMGAAFSLINPALMLIAVGRVSETARGAAMGTFTAFFDLGVGVGAPLAGLAAALTSYEGAFVFAAAAALGSATIVLLVLHRGAERGGRDQRRLTIRLCAARPIRPSASKRTDSAVATPVGCGSVTASTQIHSPAGIRSRWTVSSTLTKMNSRKSSAAEIPLPTSAATIARCSGVGSSPATSGTRIRSQAVAGPISMNPPAANETSIAVW